MSRCTCRMTFRHSLVRFQSFPIFHVPACLLSNGVSVHATGPLHLWRGNKMRRDLRFVAMLGGGIVRQGTFG
jgi:hypothetical protein